MTIALAPEPAGDVPVAPSPVAETLNAGAGGGIGGSGGTGGGGTGGGGDGAGASQRTGGTAVAAPPTIDFGPLRAQAMERIRQQRRYPELARRRRIEGTVTIGFRVAADGGVTGVRVKRGVDELLDEAALDAVRAAAPLPAALSRDGELEVLLQFYLRP
jgi:protein TonB